MALQIERKPGEDFYVRNERFELTEIQSLTACTIVRSADGSQFQLNHEQPVEIAPQVKAMVGKRGQLGLTRIVFDADRSIPIARGELYRGQSTQPSS